MLVRPPQFLMSLRTVRSVQAPRTRWFPLILAASGLLSCAATLPVGTDNGIVAAIPSGSGLAVVESGDAGARTHTVQAGDTLWRIANSAGTTVDELARTNGIDDPAALRVGMTLNLPASGGAGATVDDAISRAKRLVMMQRDGSDEAPVEPPRIKPPVERENGAAPAKAPPPVGLKAAASTKTASRAPPKRRAPRVTSAKYPLRWPVQGSVLRRYGRDGKKHHDGIDIDAKRGVPVRAAGAGRVVFADEHGGYGKLVLLRHDDGMITVYAHHDELLVRKGQRVRSGDIIAKVGSTGSAAGPHLHFEVRKGVQAQNPLRFLPP